MVFTTELVRFVDTDMMGVTHHSNFFKWFESARVEYLKQAGVFLVDLMKDGYSFPIRDVRCSYLVPALYDDIINVHVKMVELSRAKMVFSYMVKRQKDQVLLAEGITCNVFTNKEGNVTRLPAKFFQPLQEFFDKEKSNIIDRNK